MKQVAFWSLCLATVFALGNDTTKPNAISMEGYMRPSKEIEEVVTAPWYRNGGVSNLNPARTHYIVSVSAGLPKLADLARPFHNLGGTQIDFRAHRARSAAFRRIASLEIKPVGEGNSVVINPPKGATISNPSWSPDGTKISFLAVQDLGSFLYVADAKTGRIKQVSSLPILGTLGTNLDWLSDSKRISTVFVPNKRSAMPEIPLVATAPQVKVSDDKPTSLRTYAGLMNSPHEFDLLEWHATGQLGIVNVDSGKIQEVGKPAMIRSVSPQPDGSHFRITFMEKPFSYLLPTSSFGSREVIWDVTGKQIRQLENRPIRIGATPPSTPNQGGDSQRRSLSWRPDGLGFSFLQLSTPPRREGNPQNDPSGDGEQGRGRPGAGAGAAGQTAPTALRPGQKDRVMQWLPPYGENDTKVVYESDQRISGVQYSEDMKTLFISHTVDGRSRVSAVRLDAPTKLYKVVESATGSNAFYEDAGSLLTKDGPVTGNVVRISGDGKSVYLSGTRYFKDPEKDAPRSFVDRVDIESGKKERIFEADPSRTESVSLLDDDAKQVLLTRQSPTSISQTFLVDLGAKKETRLTSNRDYASDLTQARVKKFMVTRPDGIKFEVEVTYPAGAKPGDKLPAFFWFYPSEFTGQAAIDQGKRTLNINSFKNISPSNKAILLRAGYVLVNPQCPIIGAADRKNDGYIPQLRNNLSATIDAICEDGTIDRNKLGLGGHSYGAFSTLNAMVHTPFFKAGIAGDGNFNRLLTPFGFQGEQRQLWDAREVYLTMSPMLYLEQLTGAVLLYHGIEDQNMGTDPINSPKLFAAMEALGKNAALYMYPYEDHGQIAEETILDQWARFVAWLDKWVKNGGK